LGTRSERQGVYAGVLGASLKGLGTGMALHQSVAQADSVHSGFRPAQPTSAQARRRDHPGRLASGHARSSGRSNGGRPSSAIRESDNTDSSGQSRTATRLAALKMKIIVQTSERGIAMIIVMMVIVVLSASAALFAFSMKVETQLARNVDSESEMEWLGRSGV